MKNKLKKEIEITWNPIKYNWLIWKYWFKLLKGE